MNLHRMLARAVFIGLLAIVAYLSLAPDTGEEGFISRMLRWISELLLGDDVYADKLAHFAAYAVLGASAFWARVSPRKQWFWAPAGLVIYGVLLELIQGLGGARQPEVADAVVNAFGAFAGYFCAQWFFSMAGRLAR